MSLPELEFDWSLFLDRSTMLYGESGTGKSYAITDILWHLRKHADQIIVVAPTDPQNHTYDAHMVPKGLIWYDDIKPDLLETIWQRQEALVAVYKQANNLAVLKQLYMRVATPQTQAYLDRVTQAKDECASAIMRDKPANASERIENINKDYNLLVGTIYKDCINKERQRLTPATLTTDEIFSLKYLQLNPRLVWIWDDATHLLVKLKNNPVIQKLFFQCRHVHITLIIACHSDKALSPETKASSFMNIWTSSKSANAYFMRPSTNLDKADLAIADAARRAAFTPLQPNQKLAYVRKENRYYRFTATKREPFRFGSEAIWKLLEQCHTKDGGMSRTNPFAGYFN